MTATTRTSARTASGAPTPPRSTPFLAASALPLRDPSLILESTAIEPIAPVAASNQPVKASTRASTRRASTVSQPSLITNYASASAKDPASPIFGTNIMADIPVGPAEGHLAARSSSGKDANTPSRPTEAPQPPDLNRVIDLVKSRSVNVTSSPSANATSGQSLEETICQDNNSPLQLGQMSTSLNVTTLDDITDLNVRQQVDSLQKPHPWASVSLCHTVLVRCRIFVDANSVLPKIGNMKYGLEWNEWDGSAENYRKLHSPAPSLGSFQDLDTSDGLDSFDHLDPRTSTCPGFSQKALTASTRSTKKHVKNKETSLDPGQQLIFFSEPAQSSPGIFSYAQRQRAIASSTETAADRERVSFIANAVLYKAFSEQSCNYYGRVSKTYSPCGYMKSFPIAPGPFPFSSEKYLPSTLTYRGTDRGKFQPLTFDTPDDGRVALQSICLAFPYLRTSFEELRFGDYIRGRKKAPHLFDLFRKLPAEVRCMIWHFAMLTRTVELRYDYSVTKCWTLERVPALLQVSREASHEARKRYTLAFGLNQSPKIYFDFKRDTLFLTYEKWHGDADYGDEIASLTHSLCQSEEAKKIRHLAIDSDLLEIFARMLEAEEKLWLDEGDENIPPPEIEAIPLYTSLQSLAIVKTTIDGFWNDEYQECGCEEDWEDEEKCDVHERMMKNDKAVIVPRHSYNVHRTQQEYYKQMVAQVKMLNPDWNVPIIEYMTKRPRRQKLVQGASRNPRQGCVCGGCYSDND